MREIHINETLLAISKESEEYFGEFLKKPSRTYLKMEKHCPDGYLMARSATKEGKILAFPKSGFENGFACLIFDVSKVGSFKSFKINIPDDRMYEHSPDETIELKVALSLNLTMLAETIRMDNGDGW